MLWNRASSSPSRAALVASSSSWTARSLVSSALIAAWKARQSQAVPASVRAKGSAILL